MKLKIYIYIILLIILTSVTAGCADSKDINEKLIATAIGFDKKDGEILLFIEVANIKPGKSSEGQSSGSEKYIIIKAIGKTIPEARENLNRQLDKQLYLSATRALILTENFAKEHLVEYLYRVRSEELYRNKVTTLITNEDLEELFKLHNEKGDSIGFHTDALIMTLDDLGKSFSRTTSRLLENLSSMYTGILVPNIGIQGKNAVLTGYSVINGTTVTGFIPAEEAKSIIFLKADKPKLIYIVKHNDNNLTIRVSLEKRKIKSYYENGKISFDVKTEFDAQLMYGDIKLPYNIEDSDIAVISQTLTSILKTELTDAVDRAQKEFQCDYFQFDDEFRIKYPREFKQMNWQIEFPKAEIHIGVEAELKTVWMMDYGSNELK